MADEKANPNRLIRENQRESSMRSNRRSFLKSTGASVLGVTGISSLSISSVADTDSDTNGTEDVGITSDVEDMILQGEFEEASDLLETNDVPHGYDKQVIGPDGEKKVSASDEEISPQWFHSESTTDIAIYLYKEHDDVWSAYGSIAFHDEGDPPYSNGTPNNVADACGIVFDSSEWSALEPSEEGVRYFDEGEYNPIHAEHNEYNPNYGPTAKVHHEVGGPAEKTVTMRTELTRVDSGNDNIPVQFSYEHTYALLPLGGIDVSIALGALRVDLPSGASTAWKHEATKKPLE
ncbi:hypothetical protein [Halorhabdus amylolytica]|uniref:hypothetical protein n=1 Tax=Halorhabdus amylolytica TaxID=2559573 RepID=UPI0010AA2C7E|nr:hypothetical protein [Halorhabdus amylolytica]